MNYVKLITRIVFCGISLYGAMLWGAGAKYIEHLDARYGARYEFLTHIGVILTILTALSSILVSVVPFRRSKLLKQYLLGTTLPIETLVFLLYWGLHIYDGSLIVDRSPKDFEPVPFLTDISLHLFPSIYVWIELVFSKREKLFNKSHVILLILFNGSYLLWCRFLYTRNKKWVYPLFERLSGYQQIMFITATSLLSVVVYLLACNVQSRLRIRHAKSQHKIVSSPTPLAYSLRRSTAVPVS